MSDPDEWPEAYELASEAVKQCAESVAEDNPDFDKSQAFAVCQDRENRGELDGREAGDYSQPFRLLGEFDMDPPGPLRKLEQDDGSVRYKNTLILGPGEWTDAKTRQTLFYAPELGHHIAEDPQARVPERNGRRQNIINFNHEGGDQLKQVGHFDIDTLQADQHGNLYADVIFWNDTSASQDAVALMDRAIKSEGQQGAGGFSVEIPETMEVMEFDRERGMEKMVEGGLAGLAIVTDSAAAQAQTAQQFSNRAVALADGEAEDTGRVFIPGGKTALTGGRHAEDMDDEISELDGLKELDAENVEMVFAVGSETPEKLLVDGESVSIDIEGASIEDIRDALAPNQELQGDDEVAAAVDEYLASEGSPEDGVDEFLQWANANTDVDMDALEAAAADYLAESGAEDLSETPVSEFMAYLNDQGGEEEEEAGGGEEEEEEMADKLSAVTEENRELRAIVDDQAEALATVTERLEAIEDEPAPPSGGRERDDELGPPVEQVGAVVRDGDYISK